MLYKEKSKLNNSSVIRIAPLVGLKGCELKEGEFQIDSELYFVANPKVNIDEPLEELMRSSDVTDLRNAKWGLKHISTIDIHPFYGKEESKLYDLFRKTLLALWITKPTGASITHIFKYNEELNPEKAFITYYDNKFFPHPKYKLERLTMGDLNELRTVLKIVIDIQDNKKPLRSAFYNLYGALELSFWDARFVMFTTVLESIFTTDNQELSHKISERIAFLLKKDPNERLALYNLVKKIYDTRSKIVHGSGLSKMKNEESIKTSGELESIVNSVVNKIVIDPYLCVIFLGKKQNREEYFKKLLFS